MTMNKDQARKAVLETVITHVLGTHWGSVADRESDSEENGPRVAVFGAARDFLREVENELQGLEAKLKSEAEAKLAVTEREAGEQVKRNPFDGPHEYPGARV